MSQEENKDVQPEGAPTHGGVENGVDGLRRTDPSEVVSCEEAIAALQEALELLREASNPDRPWQDARRVLDVTGDALDVAALAIRASEDEKSEQAGNEGGEGEGEGGNYSIEEMKKLGEVHWLSLMVSSARSNLLGKHFKNVTAREPPPIAVDPGKRSSLPLVVYATQTGTAKNFAKALGKSFAIVHGKKKGGMDVVDMGDITLSDVASRRRVYFVVSTFGRGRPPMKAEAFFSSLQIYQAREREKGGQGEGEGEGKADGKDEIEGEDGSGSDSRLLAGVEIAVASLGDSRFEEFASFGFNLAHELQALGATSIAKVMVTTVDGKHGLYQQELAFRVWEGRVKKVEDARRASEEGGDGTQQEGTGEGRQSGGSEAVAANSCCVIA